MLDDETLKKLHTYAKNRGFDEEAFVREVERATSDLGMLTEKAIPYAEKLFEESVYKAKAAGQEAGRGGRGKAPVVPAPTPKPAAAPLTQAQLGTEAPKKITIDSKLIDWLQERGFTRSPDGTAFTKMTKVGEEIVRLMIDFKNSPKGNRYGYKLNVNVDPPEWKNVPTLRDHQTLLEFKGFRDKVDEPKPEVGLKPTSAAPREIPAGEGQVLMQKEAEAMETKDDQQILAEMKGEFKAEVLEQLFYSFKSADKVIVGLSYKGVKQMAMRQGHIEVKELELKETEKAWIVTCKARDKAKDLEVYGVAIQPKQITLRSGGKMSDPFALTKAVSKAQRNALRGLISEVVITEAYKRWLKEGGGR